MKKTLIFSAIVLMGVCAVPLAQAQAKWQPVGASYGSMLPSVAEQLTVDGACLQPSPFLNQWYDDWDDGLIQPYAAYSLTPEQQEAYLKIIKAFWPYNYSSMQAYEVNDEMADIIDKMLWEVSNCSTALTSVHMITLIYSHFLSMGTIKTVLELAEFIYDNQEDIVGMIDVIRGNVWYRTCANNAAWIWKSPFDIAYGDY